MELNDCFKSYVETEEEAVFFCDMDYRITYINSHAAKQYEKYGGYDMIGKSLRIFINIEALSKINMVVEWFKESPENNKVFSRHVERDGIDADYYVIALRDENQKLIGFCNKRRSRIHDEEEPYNII